MTLPPHPALPPGSSGSVVAQRRRIGIFVLVDGLGYELVRECDFLPEYELRVGLRSELGAAEVAHASLLTGRTVAGHGVTGSWVPAEGESDLGRAARPWAWLPRPLADSGFARERVRRVLAAQMGRPVELPRCPTGLLARFDRSNGGGLFGEAGSVPGGGIFGRLARWGIPLGIHPGDVPEALTFELARGQLRDGGAEFLFLRLPRLAQLLRRHGTAHASVREELDQIAVHLRQLQRFAEELVEEVEVFVFGDRAMLDVHGYVDPAQQLESAFGRNGDRILAFYDETHVHVWSPDASTKSEVDAFLARVAQGRCLPDDELRALGWPSSHVGHESIFVLDPGLAISPNYVDPLRPAAAGGYHPDLPHTLTALLGSFSPSLDVDEVRSLFALMEATAGRIVQDRV